VCARRLSEIDRRSTPRGRAIRAAPSLNQKDLVPGTASSLVCSRNSSGVAALEQGVDRPRTPM